MLSPCLSTVGIGAAAKRLVVRTRQQAGGFCYFDAAKSLLGCNSLSPDLTGSHIGLLPAGVGKINFDGPYSANANLLLPLAAANRLVPVTVPLLREAGFDAFAWVHPREKLGTSVFPANAHGAFVYRWNGSARVQCYFYVLLPKGAERSCKRAR